MPEHYKTSHSELFAALVSLSPDTFLYPNWEANPTTGKMRCVFYFSEPELQEERAKAHFSNTLDVRSLAMAKGMKEAARLVRMAQEAYSNYH